VNYQDLQAIQKSVAQGFCTSD